MTMIWVTARPRTPSVLPDISPSRALKGGDWPLHGHALLLNLAKRSTAPANHLPT